jgi:hypothetical protein
MNICALKNHGPISEKNYGARDRDKSIHFDALLELLTGFLFWEFLGAVRKDG